MTMYFVIAVVGLFGSCLCEHYLHHMSYTKLPATKTDTAETFKMFGGTAEEAAFDPTNQILYVVGETSKLLHLIDISDPYLPKRIYTHQFLQSDGIPRDVAVCGQEIAVALSSSIRDVYEGHVHFYHIFTPGDQELLFHGKVTVGPHPDMLTFTSSCTTLLVANEGVPGKDINNRFMDPEGSIAVITREQAGSPSEKISTFTQFNNLGNIREPSRYVPISSWPLTQRPTFATDVQPEYIAVSPNNKHAYVTLQENSAIAKLTLSTGEITEVHSLPKKQWTNKGIDPSDQDGGVHLRDFPFSCLLQPDVAKVLNVGTEEYLVTANEGAPTSFSNTLHGFTWTDQARASAKHRSNQFDQLVLNNDTFYEYLRLDNKTGRVYVSSIDGMDFFSRKISEPHIFGGRGFTIWKTSDFSMVYDSGDSMEKTMALLMPKVFNSDCTESSINTKSPENERDSTSDDQGLKLNAMDIVTDNGTTLMLLGSETVGALFLYTVQMDNTTSGHPEPLLESVYRAGSTDFVWNELYEMNEAGDAGISAIGFIPSGKNPSNKTMAYVIGSASGSVSLYEIKER